jgi:hypothetical protein
VVQFRTVQASPLTWARTRAPDLLHGPPVNDHGLREQREQPEAAPPYAPEAPDEPVTPTRAPRSSGRRSACAASALGGARRPRSVSTQHGHELSRSPLPPTPGGNSVGVRPWATRERHGTGGLRCPSSLSTGQSALSTKPSAAGWGDAELLDDRGDFRVAGTRRRLRRVLRARVPADAAWRVAPRPWCGSPWPIPADPWQSRAWSTTLVHRALTPTR